MMPPRQVKNVIRLADHGANTSCCSNTHVAPRAAPAPYLLAQVFGWQALLSEVIKKLGCSICNERKCTVSIFPATKRDYR